MNKRMKMLACGVLAAATLLSTTACGSVTQNILSVYDGMDLDQGYDTSMLYRNTTDFQSGDMGLIYVSPDEAMGLDTENAAQYGGYFYQYATAGGVAGGYASTEDGETPSEENGEAAYKSYVMVTRSRDLNDWEVCGAVDNGMGLLVRNDDWLGSQVWAPECIYDPVTNRYYLYFSAASKINDGEAVNGIEKTYSSATTQFDRFYLGVAVADNPAGPFELVSSENVYGDAEQTNPNGEVLTSINPAIMLDKECDDYFYTEEFKNQDDFAQKDELFSAIDIHPVFLEDGFYIYFVKHISTGNIDGNTLWGMKMKDMVTPDYSTISMLAGSSVSTIDNENFIGNGGYDVVRVEYKGSAENDPNYEANKDDPNYCINDPNYPRHLAQSWTRYTTYADGTQKENAPNGNDSGIAEGPQMLTTKDRDGKTVYILTYAARGVDNYLYDLRMAYSYNPLSGFIKPTEEQGATVLGVDSSVNNFMSNLAHVQFLNVDGETWCCHCERMAPFSGADQGRFYALASVSWQYLSDDLNFPVPVANGPTTSLQPLPSVYTGYRNIASDAEVKATNAVGDCVSYLTDGMTVTNTLFADRTFIAKDNATTITMDFDETRYIRGILLYNAIEYDKTFDNVSEIIFTLENGKECSIVDLPYNTEAYRTSEYQVQPGSAAVAIFDELPVVSVRIEFQASDKLGNGTELGISEIVILGK